MGKKPKINIISGKSPYEMDYKTLVPGRGAGNNVHKVQSPKTDEDMITSEQSNTIKLLEKMVEQEKGRADKLEKQLEKMAEDNRKLASKIDELIKITAAGQGDKPLNKKPRMGLMNLATQNRFDALEEEDGCVSDASTITISTNTMSKRPLKSSTEDELGSQSENSLRSLSCKKKVKTRTVLKARRQVNEEDNQVKPKHSPIFIVSEMSTPSFEKDMKKVGVATKVKLLPSGKQTVKVAYENREKVANWLKTNSKGAYTSTSNEDRAGVGVVKGIHADYATTHVEEYFSALAGVEIKARRFRQAPDTEGRRPPWWIITAPTRATMLNLREIKTFGELETPIRWEALKSAGPPRCYNCNGFRHVAKNCLFPTKCALCGKGHATRECKMVYPKGEIINFGSYYCANCSCKGHWTGDKECPAYKKELALMEKKLTNNSGSKGQVQMAPAVEDFSVPEKELRRKKGPSPTTPTSTPVWGNRTSVGGKKERIDTFMEGMRKLIVTLFND